MRNYFIPFLNENICRKISTKIKDKEITLTPSEQNAEVVLTYPGSSAESTIVDFSDVEELYRNNVFFGNKYFTQEPESETKTALIQLAAVSLITWGCFEEILTILGFAPLQLSNKDVYLFVDRQNESTQLTRAMNKYRLFHAGANVITDLVKEPDKKSEFMEILSEILAEMKLNPYKSQSEMQATQPESYTYLKRYPVTGQDGIEKEIVANIRRIIMYHDASISEDRKFYRGLLDDVLKFASRKGVRVPDSVINEIEIRRQNHNRLIFRNT